MHDVAARPRTAAGGAVRRLRLCPDHPRRSTLRPSARMQRILRDQWNIKAVSEPR